MLNVIAAYKSRMFKFKYLTVVSTKILMLSEAGSRSPEAGAISASPPRGKRLPDDSYGIYDRLKANRG
jgi:hypothetical protein